MYYRASMIILVLLTSLVWAQIRRPAQLRLEPALQTIAVLTSGTQLVQLRNGSLLTLRECHQSSVATTAEPGRRRERSTDGPPPGDSQPKRGVQRVCQDARPAR